jgi:hypothetical protein
MTSTIIQSSKGLSNEQIASRCPSVYAPSKHESRSDRYLYIPTGTIIDGMRQEGFIPTYVAQAQARREDMTNFTKHLIRFRGVNDLGPLAVGQEFFEIVMINSHNGGSSYELMGGFFRVVCTNGMITGDKQTMLKVHHKGDILGEILSATYKIAEEAPETMEAIAAMKQIQLSRPEQLLLAKYAMKARFPEPEVQEANIVEGSIENPQTVYQPKDFLQVRRGDDIGTDLYRTVNVLQENLIKGGVTARDTRGKKHTTRKITGIDQTVKVNQLLWQFGQELRELKRS